MDLIRRLFPLHLYFPVFTSTSATGQSDKSAGLAFFLYAFILSHTIIGILFFYLDMDLFYRFITEDSYIEYITALFLLLASALCFYKALHKDERLPRLFFFASAFLLFFGFGEEISWAQRIIGFDTPENLEKVNAQQEFNLHNIHLSGVNLNKLIFGKILYTGVFIYFLVFPELYHHKRWFSKLIDKFNVPLPNYMQSFLYMLCFFSLLLIRDGEMWEMQEFTLAGFILVLYLMPNNKAERM